MDAAETRREPVPDSKIVAAIDVVDQLRVVRPVSEQLLQPGSQQRLIHAFGKRVIGRHPAELARGR